MDKNVIIENIKFLIEEYNKNNKALVEAELEYKSAKNNAWICIDFDKELGSKPTVDMKKAYISNKTINLREKRDYLEATVEKLGLQLELEYAKLEYL